MGINAARRTKTFAILTFLLLAISCRGPQTANPSAVVITYPTSTRTSAPSTSTPTHTPSPTQTQTLTPTRTPTITWTPLPTIQPDERLDTMLDLLYTNANCQLPCWWGIIPGETSWASARRFLQTFDPHVFVGGEYDLDEGFVVIANIFVPEEIYSVRMGQYFHVNNDEIKVMEISLGKIPTFNLPTVLNDYGRPDEVWLHTIPEEIQGDLPFSIVLYYGQLGIAITYHIQAEETEDYIQGCFNINRAGQMALWAPYLEWSFDEVVSQTNNLGLPWRLLEDITDMDTESFYQIFREPGDDNCINVPKENLPPP